MELTQEQRQARFLKESGGTAVGSSSLAIFGGLALMAFVGFGFGLFVLGVCTFLDGLRCERKARAINPEVSARIVGGRAPYPWQPATPNNAEYVEFHEDSDLIKFGRFFFKAWFILWIPTMFLFASVMQSIGT